MNREEVLINIRKIVRAINLENKRIQKQFGLSIPQLLCLNFLRNRPEKSANHKEIKDYLNLNASTVTGIIARLHSKGLVEKIPSKTDKRIVSVKLTQACEELFEKAPELMHSKLNEKLKLLSDQKLTQLKDSLDFIIDLMDIEEIEAAPVITSEEPI